MTVLRLSVAVVLALAACCFAGRGNAILAAGNIVTIGDVQTDQFPEVVVRFSAVDVAGLPMTDLTVDRVRVAHNGQPVADLRLEATTVTEEPIAAVLVVDTSGSMRGKPMEDARQAARDLVESMGPRDQAAIVDAGQTVRVLQDFTGDRDALRAAIEGLIAGGDTRLYDGVFEAAGLVSRQPPGRRAIITITDGEDTKSSITLDDAIARAREVNVPVFVIAFGEVMADPVRRLALVTGGRFGEAPDAATLSQSIRTIQDLLRQQFLVRYEAPSSRPPENEVEVSVETGGQEARDVRRYGAPAMPPLELVFPVLAGGGPVRGVVDLVPEIRNARRVDAVEYLLDGAPVHRSADPPWAFRWDTAAIPAGPHELVARARLGDREAEQRLSVVVAPALSVSIRGPAPNQHVDGIVTLLAEVDALAPVEAIEWQVDGAAIARATSAPFAATWDSTTVPPGDHTIVASGRDAQGNSGRAEIVVSTRGPAPVATPTAGVAASAAGAAATTVGPTSRQQPTPTAFASGTRTTPEAAPAARRTSTTTILIGAGLLLVAVGAISFLVHQRRSSASPVLVGPGGQSGAGGLPGGPLGLPPPSRPQASFDIAEGPTAFGDPATVTGDGPATFSESPTAFGEIITAPARPTGGADRAPTPFASSSHLGEASVPEDSTLVPLPAKATLVRVHTRQPRLVVSAQGRPDRTWYLGRDQVIGRDPGADGLVVEDPTVSRRHAQITWNDHVFVYRDLTPTNPTTVNGRRTRGPSILLDQDRIVLGRTTLSFFVGDTPRQA